MITRENGDDPSPTPRVRVAYIMGVWRSGSTILDLTLGNHPEIVGVGELRNLPWQGRLEDRRCSCGSPAKTCPFWDSVWACWLAEVGSAAPGRLDELQQRFERLRAIPLLLASRISKTAAFAEYSELLVTLYRAISVVAGKKWIVDSSKYPSRALALMREPRIMSRALHLVRDCRAVAWSVERLPNTDGEARPQRVSVQSVVRHWLLVNSICSIIGRFSRESALRVRYEDFVGHPEETLACIGRHLGMDCTDLGRAVAAGELLDVGHAVAGNRLRFERKPALRADMEWVQKMPEGSRDRVWRRAWWLAGRYGYRADGLERAEH